MSETSRDDAAAADRSLPPAEADKFAPPFPLTVDQLDVAPGFLADLALKAASLNADNTTASVAETLQLGLMITDGLLQRLYDEKLLDRKGMIGLHNHRYGLTERGWQRVAQLMEQCSYIGPAPVSLENYSERIVSQVRHRPPVTKEMLDAVMRDLVLPETVKRRLGVVASSGRSLFLSGPPGNGKTAMARALVNAIPGAIWIPYAIEVDGQVIRVFDKHDHHPIPARQSDYDRRWVKIKPPLVTVGGELTIQSLDLTYTDSPRYYEAPFQLKANGGVLVVDDLGRQRCSARELLNRWIVPLEYRTDYLTLSTGKKIQVPFEQIVIFATNLKDTDLVDGAFMRRMGYRLFVEPPDAETYREIFTQYAAAAGLTVPDAVLDHLLARYRREGRQPHACEPRDLIQRAIEIRKFDRQTFELTIAVLDEAWEGYFGGAGFAPTSS
jgi:hypothetical protein